MSPKTKNSNPRPLQVKWCCPCFGTEMGQYWDITLSRALLLLLHHTLEILRSKLELAICNKHRGLLPKGVSLLHHNGRPHSVATTTEAIRRLKFELLPHLPCSLNVVPTDYHMFGPLKVALVGWRWVMVNLRAQYKYMASITTRDFLCRSAQGASEPQHNMCRKRGWLCWMIRFAFVTDCATQSN
jgi:hypothetical protein